MSSCGLVIKAVAGLFFVELDGVVYDCRASKKLKLNKQMILTGDYVMFDIDSKYIKAIKERTNELIRPKISNVANAILVFSATEPKMNFGLLDRMILIMEMNNLKTHIVVTKGDLLDDVTNTTLKEEFDYYDKIGYPVFFTNSDVDIKNLEETLKDDKFVFTGQTGVGKSTLINRLIPNLDLETQAISKALGRGKHTTREVTYYHYNKGYIIDTPGFSALEIPFTPEDARDNFIDLFKLSDECRFSTCFHVKEPNCAIKENLEQMPFVLRRRYENYVKLIEDLRS